MSKQPSPKYSCHQTSISTLQITQDTDSGPSAVTCHQPRGQKSWLSLSPPQAQGTARPWEPTRHRRAPPHTLSAHPTRGSGGTAPVGSGRQRTVPRSNGGIPAGQAAVLAEYCSRGCATPPAIQAALQSWRGSASHGWGGGRSFCQGQRLLAPEEGEQRAQAPPSSPSMLLQHKSQLEATARDQQGPSALWTSGSNPARHAPCICGTESTYPRKERS